MRYRYLGQKDTILRHTLQDIVTACEVAIQLARGHILSQSSILSLLKSPQIQP